MSLQIGPKGLTGKTGRILPYSNSKRITMHQQCCIMVDGDVRLYNLKLYLKRGRQYARTVGEKFQKHFYKSNGRWIQEV